MLEELKFKITIIYYLKITILGNEKTFHSFLAIILRRIVDSNGWQRGLGCVLTLARNLVSFFFFKCNQLIGVVSVLS